MIKGKNKIANNANMELEIVTPNGRNVVVSIPNNLNYFLFFLIVKMELKNKHDMLFFF